MQSAPQLRGTFFASFLGSRGRAGSQDIRENR